jgi:alpha-1,3-rhamnosyl/mannosyltransferase
VITVSESAAAEITGGTAITPERVRVVPNGVSPVSVSAQAKAETLARLDLTDRRYVLFVSSLEPRKGVGTLVAAFAALRRRGAARDVALVLAGFPGWLSDGLIDGADRRALGADLRQLGQVSEADLWPLYAAAEICAVPSTHEGFGLPVLEAMSQSRPVLCSDLAVLHEVGGAAVRYVAAGDATAWADALAELLDDPAAGDELGAAGLARSAQFSWERSVRATRAVYEEAIASRS